MSRQPIPSPSGIGAQKLGCMFCEIASGNWNKEFLVAENKVAIAFFPRPSPASKGHTLVIPRLHFEDLASFTSNLSHDELAGVMQLVGKVYVDLLEGFKPDGIHLIQNNGKGAEQTMSHLHFHLVPRYGPQTSLMKSYDQFTWQHGKLWPSKVELTKETMRNWWNELMGVHDGQ